MQARVSAVKKRGESMPPVHSKRNSLVEKQTENNPAPAKVTVPQQD
jgi:hypothetical protein